MIDRVALINKFLDASVTVNELAHDEDLNDDERALCLQAWHALYKARSLWEVRTGAYHDWWDQYMPGIPVPAHVPKRPVPHE